MTRVEKTVMIDTLANIDTCSLEDANDILHLLGVELIEQVEKKYYDFVDARTHILLGVRMVGDRMFYIVPSRSPGKALSNVLGEDGIDEFNNIWRAAPIVNTLRGKCIEEIIARCNLAGRLMPQKTS